MSVEQVLEDVVTGDFSDAEKKVDQWWTGLLPEVEAGLKQLASAEGQIAQGLIVTGAKDIMANGLTTASFVAAAKDVEGKLASQEITLGTQTIFMGLNAVVAANQAAATPAAAAPVAAADPAPADPAAE